MDNDRADTKAKSNLSPATSTPYLMPYNGVMAGQYFGTSN